MGASGVDVSGTPHTIDLWGRRHVEMARSWAALISSQEARDRTTVVEWRARLEEMRRVQAVLTGRGRWRGGPRSLLGALGLQQRELVLTAGLAWLLQPEGHHGLGTGLLSRLAERLAVDIEDGRDEVGVRVVVEESRYAADGRITRADLVVYGGTWTIVVEAKTFAMEQPDQLDRLHQLWGHEPGAQFVFLTRGSREATTATASAGIWQGLTWYDVAADARAAAGGVECAAGVHEYIDTLEAYHRV